jgi:hypothetical protein
MKPIVILSTASLLCQFLLAQGKVLKLNSPKAIAVEYTATSDGGLLVGGAQDGKILRSPNWITKLDSTFETEWLIEGFEAADILSVGFLLELNDKNGYLVSCMLNDYFFPNSNEKYAFPACLKINMEGKVEWAKVWKPNLESRKKKTRRSRELEYQPHSDQADLSEIISMHQLENDDILVVGYFIDQVDNIYKKMLSLALINLETEDLTTTVFPDFIYNEDLLSYLCDNEGQLKLFRHTGIEENANGISTSDLVSKNIEVEVVTISNEFEIVNTSLLDSRKGNKKLKGAFCLPQGRYALLTTEFEPELAQHQGLEIVFRVLDDDDTELVRTIFGNDMHNSLHGAFPFRNGLGYISKEIDVNSNTPLREANLVFLNLSGQIIEQLSLTEQLGLDTNIKFVDLGNNKLGYIQNTRKGDIREIFVNFLLID